MSSSATQVQPPATINTVPLAKAGANLQLLISKGRAQGYLTYEELNELLPDDAIAPDRLDALMQQFDELGIELLDEVEGNKHTAGPSPDEPDEAMMRAAEEEIENLKEDEVVEVGSKRIDDPVRMYLTQMGEIPLLTRDEEIRLAKKIELTRMAFRRKVLESDYCLQSAVEILALVESGELPFDRTMRISTAEVDAKGTISKRIPENLATVRKLLEQNRLDWEKNRDAGTSDSCARRSTAGCGTAGGKR